MAGFTQQPAIDFPEWLRALDFEDRSYRNDLAARAAHPIPETGFDLLCWVNFADPQDRERGADTPLFYVELVYIDETEPFRQLYSGDDAAEAERIIKEHIAESRRRLYGQ